MKKNSPQTWDAVWSDPGLVKEDVLILATEEATIAWVRVHSRLLEMFGTLNKLEVLEIGSGMGTYGALFAKNGAHVTLLDYSDKALQRGREFFHSNKLNATFVMGDALHFPKEISSKKFDISLSVGLAEHFRGKKRENIVKAHLDVLRKGGVAIILVPNKYNPPYRVFKFLSEILGTWKFGEEYPYSRSELKSLGVKVGGKLVALYGNSLYSSIRFILPANFLQRFFRVGLPKRLSDIRKESGTPLDEYVSYALILMLKKS